MMPQLSKEGRAQGGWAPEDVEVDHDRDWTKPTTTAELHARPPAPLPDQSRYGTATTDPLGRDGEGWHLDKNSRLPVKDKVVEQ